MSVWRPVRKVMFQFVKENLLFNVAGYTELVIEVAGEIASSVPVVPGFSVYKISMEIVRPGVAVLAHAIKKELERKEKHKLRRRKVWVKSLIERREKFGASSNLLIELKDEDPVVYRNIVRLDFTYFDDLLQMVDGMLKKQDTTTRKAIPVATQLEITLRNQSTGDSFKSLEYLFRVPEPTILKFLPEELSTISRALQTFIEAIDEWKEIEKTFFQRWNFPRCRGAIDGKTSSLKDLLSFNYKKRTYSIILFAMMDDSDYCFTCIDIGGNGRARDSAIFRDSFLNIAMESNTLGILVWRFRVFSISVELKLETTDKVIWAAYCLHNWLRKAAPGN
ncbi:hypothetical protein PR048_020034 [Dryococelus australis]|uniref:DDE Tnp4 domain-containing protein n=1 Tax=Dryococelus australis TaxID=614101 RepID=A0ABQ9H5D7_9NEOP|nr:hypothetical protein PR048_020034 [Dryococelus australis]